MPTVISHGIVALALGKVFGRDSAPLKFWLLSVLCAVLPDADVIGFSFGIGPRNLFGHRGFSHSLLFALILGLVVVCLFFKEKPRLTKRWWAIFAYFFLVTASHGLLDAFTNGGPGVAFFAPFTNTRYFFPWRPLEVSPLAIDPFLGPRGWAVIVSEARWLWMPSGALVFALWLLNAKSQRHEEGKNTKRSKST